MLLKYESLQKDVTTAGTPVALSATPIYVLGFKIRAKTANTGKIYVSGLSTINTGDELAAGESLKSADVVGMIPPTLPDALLLDLSKVYIDSTVNAEGVTVSYTTLSS